MHGAEYAVVANENEQFMGVVPVTPLHFFKEIKGRKKKKLLKSSFRPNKLINLGLVKFMMIL